MKTRPTPEMTPVPSAWARFPSAYRQREMQELAQWIAGRQSGSVVGLPGCGRSNLLGFLCFRPDVLATYLPVSQLPVLIPVDLTPLPATDLATFYKVLLRAFYQSRHRLVPDLRVLSESIYQDNLREQDPFLLQSALYDLLAQFQRSGVHLVLVLNYFHLFLTEATAKMVSSLRALRDSFKRTVDFIVGMNQEVAYLPEPERLGEMYELLDRNVCWVGAMADADAQNLIDRATGSNVTSPSPDEVEVMSRLTGNFPALLKLTALWWANTSPTYPLEQWGSILIQENNMAHRLEKLWNGLTQEEQFVLAEMSGAQTFKIDAPASQRAAQGQHDPAARLNDRYRPLLVRMAQKGVCQSIATGWSVRGELLVAYLKDVGASSRGRIRLDPETQEIYQGLTPMTDLTPLEMRLLRYLVQNPRKPHTKDALIAHVWESKSETMLDNDLQQLVYRLRKKLDTNPPRYIITWKGRPGGYQFYPEGRPR